MEPKKKEVTPIWPLDDDQLIQWRKDLEEGVKRQKQSEVSKDNPLTPERKAEIHLDAKSAVENTWAKRPRTKHIEETPRKEKTVKDKTIQEGKKKRFGQTKIIDDLLKQGKNEKEITDVIKEKIPSYPIEKIPKMIRLRQYHIKRGNNVKDSAVEKGFRA